MTEVVGSALIRRHIGRRFAALRRGVKISQEEAARRLERSRATIVRIEDGDASIRFREVDVRQMLELYSAPDGDRELLLALTAETRTVPRKSWWHDYTETELPSWFQLYVTMESGAQVIQEFGHEVIPGLLQSQGYAELITRKPAGFLDESEIARRVQVRLTRQQLLTQPRAPHLEVVLSEAALRRVSAAPEIAAEQFDHLLSLTGQGNVSIQVVPWSAGVHVGMSTSNSFTLFCFPLDPVTGQPLEPPLAYVESFTGALYLTKPAEVQAYAHAWRDLGAVALDPQASRILIRNYREGLLQ